MFEVAILKHHMPELPQCFFERQWMKKKLFYIRTSQAGVEAKEQK